MEHATLSQDCEFELHLRCRDYLTIKILKKKSHIRTFYAAGLNFQAFIANLVAI